ncbi:NAD-dependent protein deacetylase hst1 [Venturia inaequalis]|nr:NAD-dependent protein deacetylase hst1 [Venturia inaequalis]
MANPGDRLQITSSPEKHKVEDQPDCEKRQRLAASGDKEASQTDQVAKARVIETKIDLPIMSLPPEIRRIIYNYSFMRIAKVPDHNSDCRGCTPYPLRRPPYWLYADRPLHHHQHPPPECILSDFTILRSEDDDLISEAGLHFCERRTFYFSLEGDSLQRFPEYVSPGLVLSGVRHIEIDLTQSWSFGGHNEVRMMVEGFLRILQSKFKLDTLKIPVMADTRIHYPEAGIVQYYSSNRPTHIQTILRANCMDLLYSTLHSGSIGSLHWIFNKVACDNTYLHDTGRGYDTPPHQFCHLVHLLNEEASKDALRSTQRIGWWQKSLDRLSNGTRNKLDKAGRYEMTTFAKWDGKGVLIMRPKKAGDSDQETLNALRKLKDIRASLGYKGRVFGMHDDYLAANGGSALLT